jgi:glucosamine-6-phosphate deaminase
MLSYGGVDLFLGGMGENGHIAFNESGTGFGSRTRVVDLAEATRQVNVCFESISTYWP